MNHGAISVIYLALSAVCLIGLYGIYKPNIDAAAGNTFGKVERFTDQGFAGVKGNGNHANGNHPNNPAKPNKPQNNSGLHPGNKANDFYWNGIKCESEQHHTVKIIGGTPASSDWYQTCPPQIRDAYDVHFASGSMSHVNDMSNMFAGCENLRLVTGNPDTSKVTNMDNMFSYDDRLYSVSAGDWNTSKVTSMNEMFEHDSNLGDVSALGNWDTSKVTSMKAMFRSDINLSDVSALGNWDTSNVTNMSGIFDGTNVENVPDNLSNAFN